MKPQKKGLTVRAVEWFVRWGERGHERAARRIAIAIVVVGAAALFAFLELMLIASSFVGNGATLGTPPVVGIVVGNVMVIGAMVAIVVRQIRERCWRSAKVAFWDQRKSRWWAGGLLVG